jgi:trans-L-3-hydroxyproline dehydratase
MNLSWEPPENWLRLSTIDAHTAGEPLRVIVSGFPVIPGDTILKKRRFAQQHFDHLRRALMWEPRGHADMYGCLLTEPVTPDGDVGVLFLQNEGFSTMCGHGIIGLVKVGVECGLFAPSLAGRSIRIDTPAGRVVATAQMSGDSVGSVSFRNVPSFVLKERLPLDVPGLGRIQFDLAFGGAFYAYVDAQAIGVELEAGQVSRLIEVGKGIKQAVTAEYEINHPSGEADLNFLYGTILVGPSKEHHSRNVCVFADGEVDRSPTGTGVSGRAAIHYAEGELALNEWISIESLIGTSFQVRVAATVAVGELEAIVPEVSGSAHITGRNELLIDPADPLRSGFLLR